MTIRLAAIAGRSCLWRKNLLWKNDFAKEYLQHCGDLRLVNEERPKYTDGDNVDSTFLLEKEAPA